MIRPAAAFFVLALSVAAVAVPAQGAAGKVCHKHGHRVKCPVKKKPPAPTPPPPITPPPPAVGSRANPTPIGSSITFQNGWQVSVLSVTPDATQQVLNQNMFNDPPAPGYQFLIATISATYTGPSSSTYDAAFKMRAVGASNVSYTTFDLNPGKSCGVIPNEFPSDTTVFSPATISGNVCWSVATSDVASLEMYDASSRLSGTNDFIFWALH